MPELPEVETIKETLKQQILGERIADVKITLPRLIRTPKDPHLFRNRSVGLTITDITRRGKYLIFHLPPYRLISHLRMEGRYSVHRAGEPIEKHTHLIFLFQSGRELRYKDVRQFGTFDLVSEGEEHLPLGLTRLGIEPLTPAFTLEAFHRLLTKPTKRNIKAFLLDQKNVAGLGNIYVDEALFHAGIDPERPVSSLTAAERERLFAGIEEVLRQGIRAGGATVRTYRNASGEMGYFQLQLFVYGREGKPCYRCGNPIERIVVQGRGTHLCRHCQH